MARLVRRQRGLDALRADSERLQTQLAGKSRLIEKLEYVIARLAQRHSGRSSEKAPGQHELSLFNEADLIAMSGDVGPDDEGVGTDEDSASNTGEAVADAAGSPAPPSKRSKPRRPRVLPDDLERVRVVHELDETERHAACGGRLVAIGEKITEQLGMMPATHFAIQHVKIKYACACIRDSPRLSSAPRWMR